MKHTMKRTLKIVFAVALALSLIPFFVSAQTNVAANAGTTPESPLYVFDRIGEAIRQFLTFNPDAKARLQMEFAAERVAEITVVLETKGVTALGLDVAQARLQTNLANAASIIAEEKAKQRDVTGLTQELNDDADAQKDALAQAFKEKKRTLELREDELKAAIRAARETGDTARADELAKERETVHAERNALRTKRAEQEESFENEEKKLEREFEDKKEAEEAIAEAEQKKKETIDEAATSGITVPPEAFGKFDRLLAQAKELFQKENYQGAEQLAEQARKSIRDTRKEIEDVDEARDKREEAREEQEQKEEEARTEQDEMKREEAKQDAERLREERKQAEEETRKAEELLRNAEDEE